MFRILQPTPCRRSIHRHLPHTVTLRTFTEKLQIPSTHEPVSAVQDDDHIATDTQTQPLSQSPSPSSRQSNLRKRVKDYKTLSKWNLSVLNGIVTGSTAFICSGGALFSCTIPATIGCISLAISASSLNQIQESEYDKLMSRTKLIRPLCNGAMTRNEATLYSAITLTVGVSTLSIFCGNTAAMIGFSTMLLYNALYTPLKRVTPYNTEFGAIVGALPPQIGIAASHFLHHPDSSMMDILMDTVHDPLCWCTFYLLYCWQMPHFLFLSIRNKRDYLNGGFKMWSGIAIGANGLDAETRCKRKSLFYGTMLVPLPLMVSLCNVTSMMFAFDGTVLGVAYWMTIWRWYRQHGEDQKAGKSSFYFNLMYLPAILFLMTIHSKRWKYKKGEFWSTHLAYLQDRGIEHCLFGGVEIYEPSELPPYTSVTRDCLKMKDKEEGNEGIVVVGEGQDGGREENGDMKWME